MKKQVVLTIDLEDWFHSLDPFPYNWGNYERRVEYGTNKLLDFLASKDCTATFFVLGDVAVNNPSLIKRIYNEKHEIGSHGFNHLFIYKQTRDEFKSDLRKSLSYLSDLTGEKIISYRAPYFSIVSETMWAFDILAEEGIKNDSSIFPVINHRYGIPGNQRLPYRIKNDLWEWPITTFKSMAGNIPFSGGVYFRFLPFQISKKLMISLLKNNEPILFYIHPWELDAQQPVLKIKSFFLRFRHYYGLKGNSKKLFSLLDNIKTITLNQGVEAIKRQGYE